MPINYGLDKEEKEELREVIKEFLSKYRYLYEIRLQKLIYYSELYCIDNYECRITKAKFKPYMYGSFSETVRNQLRELNLPTESVNRHGNETTKYLSYRVDGGDLSEDKKKIIDRIHQKTRGMSTDELAEFSKDSWLFEEGSKGEEVDFNDYLDYLDEHEIDKEDRQLWDPESPEIDSCQESDLVILDGLVTA